MNILLLQLAELFKSKVNLLIVDDDRHVLKTLSRYFTSPAFNVSAIDDFKDAVAAAAIGTWHCWLLDIDLGDGRTGLDIMKEHPTFPFIIILSGLQSMRMAGEAVKQGAMEVFDKDPHAFDRLFDATCRAAALGYVMGGKQSQYMRIFKPLTTQVVTSLEDWARVACISERQLHRVCEVHPFQTPHTTLAAYYGLYALLWQGQTPFKGELPPGIGVAHQEYLMDCINWCLRKETVSAIRA